jgi:hypothetical protein
MEREKAKREKAKETTPASKADCWTHHWDASAKKAIW